MTHPTSDMQLLLEQPHLLLEGRIAFRRNWVARHTPPPPAPPKIGWEFGYDEEHNFAHMGARYIDDEEWGRAKPIKPRKPRAKRLSDFLSPAYIAETAEAINRAA